MLRFLAYQGRAAVSNTNWSVANFSQTNHQSSYSSLTYLNGYNDYSPKRKIPSLFLRMFSHYRVTVRIKKFSFQKSLVPTNLKSHQPVHSRELHTVSSGAGYSPAYSAQLAWKRLNIVCSYTGPSFSRLSRVAYAMTLSIARCQLVQGILSVTLGHLAWPRTVFADSHFVPVSEVTVMKARDFKSIFSSRVYSILEGVRLVFRTLYLIALFLPATSLAPFSDCLGPEFRKKWLRLVHRSLEKAGPAFIKWGQWAATRPDLFPNDLCLELTKLHSTAPSHSFSYTKREVEKAFGRKIHEIFDKFEETPVASGSIAQVHRACLKGKSVDVAVKVRHPGVGESIRRDFVLINSVARISSLIPDLSWLRLDESVRQFAVFMMSQVDLSREATHLSRFLYNFRKWRNVSFPQPLYPYVHPSVLVETFEKGESVSHFIDNIVSCGNDVTRKDLAHLGTYAFLKMLLVDNFIHADMHPGNILVRLPQQSERRIKRKLFRKKPHLVFLDVGMTAELSKQDRANLREFFKAVALRDGRTAAQCTLRLSANQSCPNPEGFIEELERTFAYWGTPEGDQYHPADCMHQLLETVRRHRVNVDGNVCTVLVTTLVLEGWQRKLDPDFDIMNTLKNLLLEKELAPPRDWIFS
ncbi:Protein kinase superfamily protein [Rhynchospora pubera]|uniref:Protein kinase superfamily protein n=1 Tax=Rhynchospora pubera TaxID=906938 RepID=A0AAV8BRI7_9POAL|nr:Protein kinase superfamily protein [Rhynchospora pubera]